MTEIAALNDWLVTDDPEALEDLIAQYETLRNFAEACCEIMEHSRNPVQEITSRLDDIREIAYAGRL